MKKVLLTCLIVGLTGCASIQQIRPHQYSSAPSLNLDGSAYIMVPSDGKYMDKNYQGSGSMTAQILESSFLRYLRRVEISKEVIGLKESFRIAQKGSFMYLIYPKITHWEDRATEWSGIRDKVDVKINIFQSDTEKQLDSVMLRSKGTWFTFGGYHPQDILRKAIDRYVDSLFQKKVEK